MVMGKFTVCLYFIALVMHKIWHCLKNTPAAKASEKTPMAHVKVECPLIPLAAEYSVHVRFLANERYASSIFDLSCPARRGIPIVGRFQTARTSDLMYLNIPGRHAYSPLP